MKIIALGFAFGMIGAATPSYADSFVYSCHTTVVNNQSVTGSSSADVTISETQVTLPNNRVFYRLLPDNISFGIAHYVANTGALPSEKEISIPIGLLSGNVKRFGNLIEDRSSGTQTEYMCNNLAIGDFAASDGSGELSLTRAGNIYLLTKLNTFNGSDKSQSCSLDPAIASQRGANFPLIYDVLLKNCRVTITFTDLTFNSASISNDGGSGCSSYCGSTTTLTGSNLIRQ